MNLTIKKVSKRELQIYFDAILDNKDPTVSNAYINELFSKHDTSNTGYMNKNDFINFCVKRNVFDLF